MASDLTPVTTAQTAWNTACTANVTAQQAAESTTQQKNADRTAVNFAGHLCRHYNQ